MIDLFPEIRRGDWNRKRRIDLLYTDRDRSLIVDDKVVDTISQGDLVKVFYMRGNAFACIKANMFVNHCKAIKKWLESE